MGDNICWTYNIKGLIYKTYKEFLWAKKNTNDSMVKWTENKQEPSTGVSYKKTYKDPLIIFKNSAPLITTET